MDRILILDFGSQFTQLIARRVREMNVHCEIHPHRRAAASIRALSPCGIILSGGPNSILAKNAPQIPATVFDSGVPVLGVCYGMQAMAAALGGEVKKGSRHEYGGAEIGLVAEEASGKPAAEFNLFAGLEKTFLVWMSHGDRVVKVPEGFSVVATSGRNSIVAAMADEARRYYGLQFHPEVAHTKNGRAILTRFVKNICRARAEWTMPNFAQRAVRDIRAQTQGEGVLLGLSGGVDSSVAAALLHRAVGDQLHCVLVDHGLMRAGEVAQVRDVFVNHFGVDLTVVDAPTRFFAALRGIADPEKKRKVIGAQFVKEFQTAAKKFSKKVHWLAQGTIYPDVVESAAVADGGKAVIKSHHNVGGLPRRLQLKLLEPLRELFKDEVRALGLTLGLPQTLVMRHPFPGPGLALRVLGEVSAERVAIARQVDTVFMAALARSGWEEKVAQAFAVLLPVRTVGVMGDLRTYQNVVALRAVVTDDFMTADWARLPHEFLAEVSSEITNTVAGVNRVVYDISSKPPATVEWE